MYLGFLRAINLGSNRRFGKDAIVRAVEAAGFTDVATHINTGNVRFATTVRSRRRIEAALEAAFLDEAGFEVPTIVFTPAELREIAAHAATSGHEGRHYVYLLKDEPSAAAITAIEERSSAEEIVKVGGRAVHLMVQGDYHTAKLTTAVVERHLGVSTNRNLTVIKTVLEKWCGVGSGTGRA